MLVDLFYPLSPPGFLTAEVFGTLLTELYVCFFGFSSKF